MPCEWKQKLSTKRHITGCRRVKTHTKTCTHARTHQNHWLSKHGGMVCMLWKHTGSSMLHTWNDMLFRSSNTNFDLTEQLLVEVHLQFSLPGIWEFPSPQDGGLRRSFHKNLRYRKHFQSFPTFVFSLQATTHFNTRQGNQSQQSKRKRGRVLESKSTPQPHFTFVSKSTCRLWTIRICMLDVMTRSIKL